MLTAVAYRGALCVQTSSRAAERTLVHQSALSEGIAKALAESRCGATNVTITPHCCLLACNGATSRDELSEASD
jgi:hypothetical protein